MEYRVFAVTFDDRDGYRRDKNYPHVIFLASVLRWAVDGTRVVSRTTNGITEHYELDRAATISDNSRALDSTAAFLADLLESKKVSIYSKHSRLPLGNTELAFVLSKLRGMDGGEVGGLIGDDGLGYYLNGHELFIAVMNRSLPVEDDFQKGGVWSQLASDAPPDWRDSLVGKAMHYESEEGIAGAGEILATSTAESRPKLNRAQTSLAEIVERLEKYAESTNQPFDREQMPGPLGSGWNDDGSFHWLCAKIDPLFKKAPTTFEKHRAGVCAVQKYAAKSNFYKQAWVCIAPTLAPTLAPN